MRYVEAPAQLPRDDGRPVVFLAGGISGVEDWQVRARRLFDGEAVTLINPRRAEFPLDDPHSHAEQVAWEHQALRRAHLVLFWFAAGDSVQPSVQPIALFELGSHTARNVAIVVGADPDYPRRRDVVAQLGHARPQQAVWPTLEDTVTAARGRLSSARGWAVRAVEPVGWGFWQTSVHTDLGVGPAQVVWTKRRAWRAARMFLPDRGDHTREGGTVGLQA